MEVEISNVTLEPTFYIFAFPSSENQRIIVLMVILVIYLIILSENLLIISLIILEPQLHTPMYFFLGNLSTLDILYTSTTLPKLVYVCHTGDHVVSYAACVTQMYLSLAFGCTEIFLLTTMAIDRYVAVCFPLHYSLIISRKVCWLLTLPAWVMSLVNASILTLFVCKLTFFGSVVVQNFYCELKTLMHVSSGDTTYLMASITVEALFVGFFPSCLILASYVRIIHTVLKMKSSAGRWKTFSSCSSHVTIVVLFFGSGMILYLSHSLEQEFVLSLMFVTLVPMLNPVVYSLRNKDITQAIRRVIDRILACSY